MNHLSAHKNDVMLCISFSSFTRLQRVIGSNPCHGLLLLFPGHVNTPAEEEEEVEEVAPRCGIHSQAGACPALTILDISKPGGAPVCVVLRRSVACNQWTK